MRSFSKRTWVAMVAVSIVIVLTACSPSEPAASTAPDPIPTGAALADKVQTIVALGDSITLGVNACAEPGPCANASWVSGSDAGGYSLAARIGGATGNRPEVINLAKDGGKVIDAVNRIDATVAAKPQLVTIMVGANDACAPSMDEVTPVEDFDQSVTALIGGIAARLPDAQILALSVPDLNLIWEEGHANSEAVRLWSSSPACRSLLWNPQSMDDAEEQRRAAISDVVNDYNRSIAEACSAVARCITDNGSVHDHVFDASEISTIDYFHPSALGQRVFADLAWVAYAAEEESP